jgi:hypothetical protein
VHIRVGQAEGGKHGEQQYAGPGWKIHTVLLDATRAWRSRRVKINSQQIFNLPYSVWD